MKNFHVLALLLLLSLFALGSWGCHGKRPVPVVRGDAKDWLLSLEEARGRLKTLKAEARVEVRRKERRFRFHASILAGHPSRLYAETSGFGLAAAAVSADDEGVLAYLPSRGKAYRGDGGEVLAALLGVEQPTREWVGLLLGNLPPHADPVIRFENVGRNAILTLGNREPRVILTFDRKTSWLTSFEERSPIVRTVFFGEPIRTPAGAYPSEIRIVTRKASVDLRFEKVTADPVIAPNLFRIDLPPTVEPRPLGGAELLKGE